MLSQLAFQLFETLDRIARFREQPGKSGQARGEELVGDVHPLFAKAPLDGHIDEKSGPFVACRVLDEEARLEGVGVHIRRKREQADVLAAFLLVAGIEDVADHDAGPCGVLVDLVDDQPHPALAHIVRGGQRLDRGRRHVEEHAPGNAGGIARAEIGERAVIGRDLHLEDAAAQLRPFQVEALGDLVAGRVVLPTQHVGAALALGDGDGEGADAGLLVRGGNGERALKRCRLGLGQKRHLRFMRILEKQVIPGDSRHDQGRGHEQAGDEVKERAEAAAFLERLFDAHAFRIPRHPDRDSIGQGAAAGKEPRLARPGQRRFA